MKKKILLIAAICGASFGSIAQEEKVFTPEAGDWALGFDAAPVLNYVGNAFNGNTFNSMGTSFVTSDQTIFGKYYVDANTAYRGQIRIATSSSSSTMLVDTNTVNSAPSYVSDVYKSSSSMITLGGGLEKRKGNGRLQGYYGGELLLSFGNLGNTTNEYGATLDSANIADGAASNFRTLSTKGGSTMGVQLRGFIGVEYFIFPKISVGGEFGWGLGMSNTGEGESVTEIYGFDGASATTQTTYQVTNTTGKSSGMMIDTDNFGGAIKLLFHF